MVAPGGLRVPRQGRDCIASFDVKTRDIATAAVWSQRVTSFAQVAMSTIAAGPMPQQPPIAIAPRRRQSSRRSRENPSTPAPCHS